MAFQSYTSQPPQALLRSLRGLHAIASLALCVVASDSRETVAQPKVYWLEAGVNQANLDGSDQKTLLGHVGSPIVVATDAIRKHVYWTGDGWIRRTKTDGTDFKRVVWGREVAGMTVDPAGGKLYWTERGEPPAIKRSNLDGTGIQTIVSSGVSDPLSIALDIPGGKVYWSDRGRGEIRRANLSGGGLETVVSDTGVVGIDVDPVRRKLYWSSGWNRIVRANLDGSSVEAVVEASTSNGNAIGRISLDETAGKLYWLAHGWWGESGGLGVLEANLDGSDVRLRYHESESCIVRWCGIYPGSDPLPMDLDALGSESVFHTLYWEDPRGQHRGYGTWLGGISSDGTYERPLRAFRDFEGFAVDHATGDVRVLDIHCESHVPYPRCLKLTRLDGSVVFEFTNWLDFSFSDALIDPSSHDIIISRSGHIYSPPNLGSVEGASEGGTAGTILPDVSPTSIALNAQSRELYWTETTGVFVSDLVASTRSKIVSLNGSSAWQDQPTDVGIDPIDRRVYWREGTTIRRVSTAGGAIENVLSNRSNTTSFFLDATGRKLYWLQGGRLYRANLDGSNIEPLLATGVAGTGLFVTGTSPPPDPITIPMDPAACYDHGGDWEILAGETFENVWPGAWDVRRDGNVDAVWGTSQKRAARGQKSVWPAAYGSQAGGPEGLYKNSQDTWMTLGPFDLRNSSDAKFRFDRWMDTEAGDELRWGASTDGVNFTTLSLSGSDPQWKRDGYSMARPASQNLLGESAVWIGLRFRSDASGRREGPYVDNICVERLSDTVALNAAPVPESPENASTDVGLTPVLAWNYLTGALAYELQIAADEGFTNVRRSITTNGLTYGVPPGDLAKGATYWWRVRGRNNGSTGPWSTTWSFTTESDAPHVPLLSSPGVDAPSESTSLLLQWHALENATAYDVQVAGDDTFAELHMDTTVSQLEIEFVAPFVETDFFWRARARGMGGLSDWSEVRRFTTASSGPLVAVLRTPTHDADGISEDADLEWSSALEAQSYRVQVADDDGFGSSGKSSAVVVDTVVADTTYRVTGLGSGRVHFWRVAGIDGLGRFTWSAESRFTTLGAPGRAVTLVTPLEGSEGQPAFAEFVWHALEEAHAYHIQMDKDAQFLTPVVDDSTLTDTTYAVQSPLAYNTRYFWRVRARNIAGAGPWSEIRTFDVAVGTAAEGASELPTAFALHPNYPNPFNPSTTIQYDVPETSTVRLTVFDGLGRSVEVLGTWNLAPGTYAATWDAAGRPTGVYFVRMEAGAFVASRRMILIR